MFDTPFTNPSAWGWAIAHITAVSVLALVAGWGWYSLANGLLRIPGGGIGIAPPLPEEGVIFLIDPIDPSAKMVIMIAQHFWRVRMILMVSFGLLAVFYRYFRGGVATVCIDGRYDKHGLLPAPYTNLVCIHTGVCGAFVTLTFFGTMPLMLVIVPLMAVGVAVPIWMVYVSIVPWYLLFAKFRHVGPLPRMADFYEILEAPGVLMVDVVLTSPPQIKDLPLY